MTATGSAAAVEQRGLLALAIQRPVGVTMIVLALLVFGFVGYGKLPVTLLPELSYPTVTIRTEYPGASPEDIEDRISEPIREAVSVLGSVAKVTSISRSGQSDVIVEFGWGTPMSNAVGDIREKLDRAFLPPGVPVPLILRYDPSLDPIMTLGLGGPLDLMDLRYWAEEEVEPDLRLDDVAAVKVKGGDEKEILIALDPTKLSALGLDIRQIASQLQAENLNSSAGSLDEGETEYLVRALNEFRSLDDVRGLIVARRNNANIRLGEVATVRPSAKDKEVLARVNGKPAVLIEIYKSADANLVALARQLRHRIFGTEEQRQFVADEEKTAGAKPGPPTASGGVDQADVQGKAAENKTAKQKAEKHGDGAKERRARAKRAAMHDFIANRLPKGMQVALLTNPARYIENSIQEVLESAAVGGLLAIVVLFLFLRRAGPTLLISLSIPLSLVVTFAPLMLTDVSLNVMSLGGLALGVGMLVDTSIVVLESITRCREEGDSLISAAFRGVREVSGAVIASTLTTIAVFLPIVFVEGIAGQLFRDQALAVVFSLIVALLVSLFLLPMLASRGRTHATLAQRGPIEAYVYALRRQPRRRRLAGMQRSIARSINTLLAWLIRGLVRAKNAAGSTLGSLLQWPARAFNAVYEPIERAYPNLLSMALRARALVLLVVVAAGALAVMRAKNLGSEVLPEVHQGEFTTLIFLDRTVKVEKTDRIVKPLEQAIRALPQVNRTFVSAGIARDELRSSEEGKHSARIYVVLETGGDMVTKETSARSRIRQLLETVPAVQAYRFETPTLFSINTPVSVEVLCHNLFNLRRAAALVEARMREVPQLSDVQSTLGRGNTEVVVRFDREKLTQVGLQIGTAASRLAAYVKGEVPTRFPEREKKIDMRVRLDPTEMEGVTELRAVDISESGSTTPIPLFSVASLVLLEGPSEVRRLGSRRGAEVRGTVNGLDLASAQTSVEAALAGITLPPGVELRLGGQKVEMDRSKASMLQALLLAVFLIYVVMAAQFESLVQPLVIIFTVPLAVIGVVFALDFLSIPVSVVVFLGGIMLAGIVVNNAIVLIDRMNQERAKNKSARQAIIDGAAVRLRPVLMTTATTVLGLLPLTGWVSLRFFGSSGEGVELRAPMAITVISGLLFSTLLTLVVIPVVYSFVVREHTVAAEAATPEGTPS